MLFKSGVTLYVCTLSIYLSKKIICVQISMNVREFPEFVEEEDASTHQEASGKFKFRFGASDDFHYI